MARLLHELLGVDKRTLSSVIHRLEHMTMNQGTDIRLSTEIITQFREKARRLSLDPNDSTAEELFYHLRAKAEQDDILIREKFGITDKTSSAKGAALIAQYTQKLLKNDELVVMLAPTIKKILKAVPPKKTMRLLRFRSVDSVLKRENPQLLYALARRVEDKTWQKQVQARLNRLQARDVGEQPVQTLSFPDTWLDKLQKHDFNTVIQSVAEIGCVLILPSMPLKTKGAVLLTTALVFQEAQRMCVEALAYRTKSMHAGAEKLIPEIATGIVREIESIRGIRPSWHAVYRLIAEQTKHKLSDIDFIIGDISWESTEIRLATFVPELDFWVNTHYLGFAARERPVSLHVVDVTASLVMDKHYGEHIVSHMQGSLWNELQLRYVRHETLENMIVAQLTRGKEVMV